MKVPKINVPCNKNHNHGSASHDAGIVKPAEEKIARKHEEGPLNGANKKVCLSVCI